jgi:hypothetical protein
MQEPDEQAINLYLGKKVKPIHGKETTTLPYG